MPNARVLALTASLVLLTQLAAQPPSTDCVVNDSAFTTNQGGCQDQATNLVWILAAYGSGDWAYANNLCNNLVLAGFSNWRLPTLAEMQSADAHGAISHVNMSTGNLYYWSSGTRGNKAWAHNFYSNSDLLTLKSSHLDMLCVRPGLPLGGTLAGADDLPRLRAARVVSEDRGTVVVSAPDLALQPCFFVADFALGTDITTVRTVPGGVDTGTGTLDAAGRTTLQLDLGALGLSGALLPSMWLGLVVLGPTGPVLYDLAR